MCAVKMAYIESGVDKLKVHEIEEKSYSPIANIEGLSSEYLSTCEVIKDMAVVCTLNNKSGIRYESNEF